MCLEFQTKEMSVELSPPPAILWQNTTRTVTLFDIPCSISATQDTSFNPCTVQIYSSAALQKPYQSTEPKTEKAKANVLSTKSKNGIDDEFPIGLLHQAIDEITKNWDHGWCLQRQIAPFVDGRQAKSGRFEAERCQSSRLEIPSSGQHHMRKPPGPVLDLEGESDVPRMGFRDPLDLSTFINTPEARTCPNTNQVIDRLAHNPCSYPLSMKLVKSLKHADDIFTIPPHASFFLSKIDSTTAPAMSMAALTLHPEASASAGPGQFDCIILDPPWENRSVRRSGKYKTMREPEPMEVLRETLGLHIAPNALVACWTTNKASVRASALEAFDVWNVQLVEEWAWLKTTEHGEPVTAIDGLWRKPYEALLLGRMLNGESNAGRGSIQRRVIVAVPDLHSRKPNLKVLLKPLLPAQHRVLEVFARNLTAEWMAWGDDVLKYAWEGHWTNPDNDVQT